MNKINSSCLLKPIQSWLADDNVSEILLNKPNIIFVEQHDHFQQYKIPELNSRYLSQLFRLIANENHQILNEQAPLLSGRLKDGSRIQLVIPPISRHHTFCIRKRRMYSNDLNYLNKQEFFKNTQKFNLNNHYNTLISNHHNQTLLSFYQLKKWEDFIKLALKIKKNIVISGATSSGKTTFLNACLNELPLSERLIILEDTAEIQIPHENAVRLTASPHSKEIASITMQKLVQCSLRLRPDRIVIGEVRGKEILDYIAASLTGHGGSMTSIHAENPQIALVRMCQMYKLNTLPAMTDQDIYNEIQQAVDIILQLKRTSSGRQLDSVYLNQKYQIKQS